jgi:hypothetical protein
LTQSFPMATSEIPQIFANLVLGFCHTKSCNSVRVMDVGLLVVISGFPTL